MLVRTPLVSYRGESMNSEQVTSYFSSFKLIYAKLTQYLSESSVQVNFMAHSRSRYMKTDKNIFDGIRIILSSKLVI